MTLIGELYVQDEVDGNAAAEAADGELQDTPGGNQLPASAFPLACWWRGSGHLCCRKDAEEEYAEHSSRKAAPVNKITPISKPAARRSNVGAGMEVCVIKPTSVEEAREITETLLANRTVVLNLEGLDVDIAQRIIDFTSGSCYAINGNLQKICHYIFIITPASVDISGDFQDIFGGSFEMPLNN